MHTHFTCIWQFLHIPHRTGTHWHTGYWLLDYIITHGGREDIRKAFSIIFFHSYRLLALALALALAVMHFTQSHHFIYILVTLLGTVYILLHRIDSLWSWHKEDGRVP
ncbi:hypothetical protein QBC45DRAFT_418360 [Copromyces sp. CBS 386.78]|nr:hypothetical protein QBC45DRAFT_418360 [Copromyces sp. CBS 386.78]